MLGDELAVALEPLCSVNSRAGPTRATGSASAAAFVDTVTNALYRYYNQLRKFTHGNAKHEESLRALPRTGEGLIRFILAHVVHVPRHRR